MNKNEQILFRICKIGKIDKLKELLEKEEVELNVRDKWDSTPLYYACLCGHVEVVEFLLANGAKCEANTFDGERCLYGALTDQIRNIIKNYKVVQTKRDQYELFMEKLCELGAYYDIVFEIKGRLFKAHKCILAARSEYFRRKFANNWKYRCWIVGSHEQLMPEAFESLMIYIYTGRFNTFKVHFGACLRLAKLFELNDLIDLFEQKLYRFANATNKENNQNLAAVATGKSSNKAALFSSGLLPPGVQLTNLNLRGGNEEAAEMEGAENVAEQQTAAPIDDKDIFLMGKFGVNSNLTQTINIESDHELDVLTGLFKPSKLSCDLKELAKCCVNLHDDYVSSQEKDNKEIDNLMSRIVLFSHDLCIQVQDGYKFYVHKAFMVERCEYFRTFLHDPFNEVQQQQQDDEKTTTTATSTTTKKINRNNVAQIHLKEISRDILVEIVYFLYSNQFSTDVDAVNNDKLDESLLYDLLEVADLYLLPTLKRKCASELVERYLSKENLFDLLQMSRVYDLKKMEYACINYLAANLDQFEESQKLREFIRQDASNLKQRQETDTIDIIDDLRYNINEQTTAQLNSLIVVDNNNISNRVVEQQQQQVVVNMIATANSSREFLTTKFSKNSAFEKLLAERDKKLSIIDAILRELNLEC